jgi:hypothetical protein
MEAAFEAKAAQGTQEPTGPADATRSIRERHERLSRGEGRERMLTPKPPTRPEMAPTAAQDGLELMLSSQPPPQETEVVHLKRLTDHYRQAGALPTPGASDDAKEDRFHFCVQVRGVDDTEFQEISERAIREPTEAERSEGTTRPTDFRRFNRLLVTQAIVTPNIRDSRLAGDYGAPENVVRAWFLPGEIAQLVGVVNDLSGWADNAVERARK